MTVFTPLSIAGDLVKDDQTLLDHLAEDESRVLGAIERIAQTFTAFSAELRNAGADGLFYATTQWASASLLTYAQYERYGRKYDLAPLTAAGDDAINLLHVCASQNYLKELSDYPVGIVNWDESDPTNASLSDGIDLIGNKLALGGLDHSGWLLHSKCAKYMPAIPTSASSLDPAVQSLRKHQWRTSLRSQKQSNNYAPDRLEQADKLVFAAIKGLKV